MRRPARPWNRWPWILLSVLVLAAVAYGVIRTIGSKPKMQEVDRAPDRQELDRSIDKVTATLGEALQIRGRVQAGRMSVGQGRAKLDSLGQGLEAVGANLQQAEADPNLLQSYERVSRFARNAAKQVRALGSDAPAESLARTETLLQAMLVAAGRVRASVGSRPGNP